jgi:signal transduction histidine kinase
MGVRRSGKDLRVEVWDSGIGITQLELLNVFRRLLLRAPPLQHQLDWHGLATGGAHGIGRAITDAIIKLNTHDIVAIRLRRRAGTRARNAVRATCLWSYRRFV